MTGSSPLAMVEMLACLFLFLGVLGAGLYFLRNAPALLKQRNKGPRKLVISESRMMGNRQFLMVAEYEGKKMLIGVCPGRIDYLCSLGEGESGGDSFSSMLPEAPE